MKIKIIAVFVSTVFFASISKAQSGQLKAGVNLANVSVTEDGRVNDSKMLTSFQVGFVGDIHLASIVYLQPGLLFTGKGAKTQSGDENSTTYYKATTNPYYLEVPANLLLKIPASSGSRFFVGAGPYIAMGIAGKNKVDSRVANIASHSENSIEFSNDDPTTTNYEEGAGFGIMKRFDYGVNALAGIEGKSVVLGVNYGLGLAKLQSGSNSSADDNNKHRVLSFTLGFKL